MKKHLLLSLMLAAMLGAGCSSGDDPAPPAGDGQTDTGGNGDTGTDGDGGTDVPDDGNGGDGGDGGTEPATLGAGIFMNALCADSRAVHGAPLAVGRLVGVPVGTPAPTVFVSSACLGDPPTLALSSGGFSSPTPAEALIHFGVTLGLSSAALPVSPAIDMMVNVGGPSGQDLVVSAPASVTVEADAQLPLGQAVWQWELPGTPGSGVDLSLQAGVEASPAGDPVFMLCWIARLPALSRDTCHLHAVADGRWLGLRLVEAPGTAQEQVFVGWR